VADESPLYVRTAVRRPEIVRGRRAPTRHRHGGSFTRVYARLRAFPLNENTITRDSFIVRACALDDNAHVHDSRVTHSALATDNFAGNTG